MGLAQLQRALARIYTDAEARAQLRENSGEFARQHGLSAPEAESLSGGLLQEAESFARSLFRKRFEEAIRASPVVGEILGAQLVEFFADYSSKNPLGGSRNPALDLLGFIRWLFDSQKLALGQTGLDGLRYEEARVEMLHTHRRFAVRWVRIPGKESPSRSLVVWYRTHGKRLRRWVIG